MKKKCTSRQHIIAMAALGVFVVLGLASMTSTPPSATDPLSDGFGRVIVSNSSENTHYWYEFYMEGRNPIAVFTLRQPPNVPTVIQENVRADTKYIIRYRAMTQNELRDVSTASGTVVREDKRAWSSKTVTASNGEIVRISIP